MPVKLILTLVPYMAVLSGLYVFHNAWAAMAGYHILIAIAASIYKPTVPFRELTKCADRRFLLLSVITGAGAGAVLYFLWPFLSVPADINNYMESIGLTETTWPLFMGYYVLVNPVFEEYFWRGILGSDKKHPVWHDFLFGGYHLLVLGGKMDFFWLTAAFVVLSSAGWYWRQISRVTDGLLTATLSHMAADITVILAIYHLTSSL